MRQRVEASPERVLRWLRLLAGVHIVGMEMVSGLFDEAEESAANRAAGAKTLEARRDE